MGSRKSEMSVEQYERKKARQREYYRENKERIALKNKLHYEANKEKYREWQKKFWESNPGIQKWYSLKSRYGLSKEQYLALCRQQNYRCLICKIKPEILVVDHDHKCCADSRKTCGKCIRGLLCDDCNKVLGLIHDNLLTAKSIVSYLE